MTFTKTNLILPGGLLLSLISAGAILLLPPSPARLAFALLLVCLLPGWVLVEAFFAGRVDDQPDALERLLLAAGASYLITIVGGLWLYYAAGQLTLPILIAFYLLICVAGFGWAIFRGNAPKLILPRSGPVWLIGAAVALFAGYFRFVALSYSDYRGDEAEVILRALAVTRGAGEPILSHTKGPAEILLAAATGLLYGAYTELSVRWPFALANLLAVGAVYLLGKELFSRKIGLIGVLLALINGWFVTYGRTAQYQNEVLFMLILGIWAFARFYRTGQHRYHLVGAALVAVATFGHYEGASAGPAALYLLILGLRKHYPLDFSRPWTARLKPWWPALLSALIGAIILLSFYAPFVLNPTVSEAQSHVAKRFGDTPPYNNWDPFYVNALFYNTTWYVWGMAAALLAGTLLGLKRIAGRGNRGTVAALISLPALLLCWTGLLPAWYGLLVYLALMALFLRSNRVEPAVKTMLWWILFPAGLYLFAVVRPGNHYYVYVPALILLAAFTADKVFSRLNAASFPLKRAVLVALVALAIGWYGLSAWYQQMVFMQTDTEYMLTYPAHKNPLFINDARFPFGIRIGWGFPYRLGWQTVAELYRTGQLSGDWYSNDAGNSLTWYTLGNVNNPCFPRHYILTDVTYKEPPLEVSAERLAQYYALKGEVQVNGQSRLRVYEFNPLRQPITATVYTEPATGTLYLPELFRANPMENAAPEPSMPLNPAKTFKPHPDMLNQLVAVYNDPNVVQFPDQAVLTGYDLDLTYAQPGGVVILTMYWQAPAHPVLPYKVFTHLERDGKLWAQADDEPACGTSPTYTWQAGDRIVDRHVIALPADIPPGEYPLVVGLYELRSGLRMDVLDEAGNPAGNWLTLPPVTIR